MLDYAEQVISNKFSNAVVAASLPAKNLYLKRGYKFIEYNIIPTDDNDFLCYDVMEKRL